MTVDPSPRLVVVEWEDSLQKSGWRIFEDEPPKDEPLVCHSVGWLVLDGEQVKVIAPHVSFGDDPAPYQASGMMVIPCRAILSLVDIRKGPTLDLSDE